MALQVRPRQVGDLGWACGRQASLYAEEFGYLPVFEEYVLRSVVPFLDKYDAAKDALWVAEQDGRRVGCIAIQHGAKEPSSSWAQLRWYFVEKGARGQGAGTALIDTAMAFVREAGYAGVCLWTVDDLHAARRRYERLGFKLAHTEERPCEWAPWGHEQRWELPLP